MRSWWKIGMVGMMVISTRAADEKPKSEDKPADRRTELNLLGKTDAQSGESRRNENVQFNQIDNNAQKELALRLGTSATLTPVFEATRSYYGGEFGTTPTNVPHLPRRSGPRGFHGTLFATHGNSVFSARSFFQAGSVKPARDNNYGLSFLTPLGRFGEFTIDASQQKLRGFVNGNILVPRPEERLILATDPAVRALLERWVRAYPTEAPNRTDINPRALNTNAPQQLDTDAASLRWDRRFGDRLRLSLRHAWTAQVVDAFQLIAGQNPDTATRSHTSRLTADQAFNPRTTLAATLGFDRVHSLLAPEPNAVGPQVQVGTAFSKLGPSSEIPLDRVQNRYRGGMLLTRQQGRHRFTVGGEMARLHFQGSEESSRRGNWYFRNDFGRDAITNFRLGIPSRISTAVGDAYASFRRWEQWYYAGDTWQARPWLTLSYGLRYEPALGVSESNKQFATPYNGDYNNLAPRFGFAASLPGRWGVLRGSYGTHFSEFFAITLQQLRWNPAQFYKIEIQAPPTLINPLAGVSRDRTILFDVPRDLRTPYSHQYNFTWEFNLPQRWRVQTGYVGSRTHKLFYMWYTNRAEYKTVNGQAPGTANVNDRRPDPRYYDFRSVRNMSRAYFDAGRVSVIAPTWRGLGFDASYWFSKAIDLGATYVNTAAGDDARNGFNQDWRDVHGDLKGPSAFDQSHAALVRWRYEAAPRVRLVHGWNVQAVFLAKTGVPFSVITGSDAPGFGNSDGNNGDRPHVVDPAVLGRTIGNPDTARALLPLSAFRFLSPGDARGNLGQNTFRRGGIRNLNASLGRTWRVYKERNLSFRAESINLTNTPQYAEPNNDMTNPAFGLITNTLNDGRTLQFTLQFKW